MENQNTTPNEPQNDIYELLKKVVETNEESIKSANQAETIHLEARNFYQSAQNAIIGSTNMMQKAIQFVRTELDSIWDYKTSIPESIPAHLSEKRSTFLKKLKNTSNLFFQVASVFCPWQQSLRLVQDILLSNGTPKASEPKVKFGRKFWMKSRKMEKLFSKSKTTTNLSTIQI